MSKDVFEIWMRSGDYSLPHSIKASRDMKYDPYDPIINECINIFKEWMKKEKLPITDPIIMEITWCGLPVFSSEVPIKG